jgi:heterodisulfide reductase subunit C
MTGIEPYKEDLEGLLDRDGMPYCHQCSRCTSACPAALATGVFNPRLIILCLLLGEDLKDLEDEVIWMCLTCHSCEEACPKGVRVAGIINDLRNEAFGKGKAPRSYTTNATLLLKSGMVANLSGADRLRKQVGLGELRTPDIKAINTLLEGTRLKKVTGEKNADGGGKA